MCAWETWIDVRVYETVPVRSEDCCQETLSVDDISM